VIAPISNTCDGTLTNNVEVLLWFTHRSSCVV